MFPDGTRHHRRVGDTKRLNAANAKLLVDNGHRIVVCAKGTASYHVIDGRPRFLAQSRSSSSELTLSAGVNRPDR